LSVSSSSAQSCYNLNDASFTLSASGGNGAPYEYSKDNVNWQSSATFSSLAGTSWTGYVRNNNRLGTVTSVSVGSLARSAPYIETYSSQPTCNGGSNGSITLMYSTISGGIGGPYATKLTNSNGTTTLYAYQTISGNRVYGSLSTGTYRVYVKDSSSTTCEQYYSVTVTEPSVVSISTNVTYTTCHNGSNGSIIVTASGGSGTGYEYRIYSFGAWGSWQSSGTFSSLIATSYTVQGRDGLYCESGTLPIDMTKSAPNATIIPTNISCNGGSNGSIATSSPNGGNSGTYSVSIDNTTYYLFPKTFNSLTAGDYTVYIKDSQACVASYGITLTQPTAQSASVTRITDPTWAGNLTDGVIQLSSTDGVWPKTYRLYADTTSPYVTCGGTLVNTWTNVTLEGRTFNVSGVTTYGYCLEVTDANGCVKNSAVTEVPVPPAEATFSRSSFSVSTSSTSSSVTATTITVIGATVTIRLTSQVVTGNRGSTSIDIPGVGLYSTSLQTGTNFVDFNLAPGTYSVTNWTVTASTTGPFTVVTASLQKL
jgi:hypothetical protein